MITRGLARSQTQAQRKGQMKRDISQAVNKGEDYLARDRARNKGGAGPPPAPPRMWSQEQAGPSLLGWPVPGTTAGASLRNTGGLTGGPRDRDGELQRETALGKVRPQLLA